MVPSNRLEVFYSAASSEKWGTEASSANPVGVYQESNFGFGNPILKVQDEQTIGRNALLSLKFTYSDSGYNQAPMSDLGLTGIPTWDNTLQSYTVRPRPPPGSSARSCSTAS